MTFFIWTHSEADLLKFIQDVNNVHPTITFSHEYSKTRVNFLDVTLEKNSKNELATRVFEKPSNCHQYVEYSSCHPGSCKSGIPFSQAKRYRRITSNKDQFTSDCNNIREHFKNRNYPDSVVDQAIAKAAQLSTDEALQPTTKSDSDVIPFVCTFNPSLPNIGKTVNQYWGLLKNSSKNSVKEIFKCKPVIAYKRPSNLQDILVHSHLNRSVNKDCKISKCCRARCTHCKYITESKHFSSSVLCRDFQVKHNLTCSSSDVIYLITCKKCKLQYVGQTSQKCSVRMNSHKFDIKHYPNTFTTVAEHFNSKGHSMNDFSFMPIDKINNNWKRLLMETEWMYKLNTVLPDGMNTKLRYKLSVLSLVYKYYVYGSYLFSLTRCF